MDSMFNTLLARALAGGSGGGGGGTGTDDYTDLNNKPKVNNVTVVGNLTSSDLKLQGEITNSHKLSADLVDDSTSTNKFNVQADWDQTSNSAPDYIKNKPTLGTAAATDATAYATAAQGTKADSAIQTVNVNGTALTPTSAKAVNITVPTQASDINALPNTTKYAAALSLTINSSTFVMTGQLKDQNGDNLGTAQTIDLPLESVVVGGSYNSQTKKVVLTLQNGNTIEFSVADLVSGLQTELSASNKLNPAYINYDSTHRAVSDTEKSAWNSKQNALTFDGTYSASTNKAATVSTVTNAVNALDVTGDASVSASKTISAWSETDGKVSISTQDIAIAGTQTTLTGYAKSGTAGQAVAATDNVNQAIGKLEATVDDNKNNISSVANVGVKNLCKPNVSADREVTVVVNADLSITVTCNTTALREVHIFTDLSELTDGKDYTLSGCNGGNYSNTYGFAVRTSSGTGKAFESDGETTFTKTAEMVKMDLIIRAGQNWTKTFHPMIRPAYISDTTYQPYAMSNAELTAKEQQNENNILLNTNSGVKNIWKLTIPSNLPSGFTITKDTDGGYIFNGTTGSSALVCSTDVYFESGDYVLSGCPANGSDNSYRLDILRGANTNYCYGEPVVASNFTNVSYQCRIRIAPNYTCNNLKFYPMICKKSLYDADSSYQPYAMSNAVLTAAIQALQAQLANLANQ